MCCDLQKPQMASTKSKLRDSKSCFLIFQILMTVIAHCESTHATMARRLRSDMDEFTCTVPCYADPMERNSKASGFTGCGRGNLSPSKTLRQGELLPQGRAGVTISPPGACFSGTHTAPSGTGAWYRTLRPTVLLACRSLDIRLHPGRLIREVGGYPAGIGVEGR